MKKITKVLIANRGEIAVRIIRACREMGIATVAVYSDADKHAMHVRCAEEAFHIGPAAPGESYLRQDALIDVARRSGSDAIHPGYGFLAENSRFAELCATNGITYIGPSPRAIALLGDKVASRRTMADAGVPVVPGCDTEGLSDVQLAKEAEHIGFPVLIKAAAGGGGKGMRVVLNPGDFQGSLEAARREAKSAFGNDTVFLERFLVEPRHIEFQIFADSHGHYVHLYERECSIQRRHQKIIEETPSPALNDDLRRRMGEAAVMVAKAAEYVNAGTVEFLLDKSGEFYFLEVNTRIQVEHPITEATLGVDLVKEQIRVAAGAELSWGQNDLKPKGHALECRIYAEDPTMNFLPSAGPVYYLKEPSGPGVRFDSGVESGDEVSVHYDPIVAKLVVHAESRRESIRRAVRALDDTVILGLTNNREFLRAVLEHPEFQAGNLHIGFLQQHIPQWTRPELNDGELLRTLALASMVRDKNHVPAGGQVELGIPEPWQMVGSWQLGGGARK